MTTKRTAHKKNFLPYSTLSLKACCLCLLTATCAPKTVPPSAPEPPPTAERPRIRPTAPADKSPAGEGASVSHLYRQGLLAYQHGQYQQALAKMSALIKLDYTLGEAYWARGEIYYDLGNHDQALKNYRQALQYDPQSIDSALQAARILMKTQDYETSRELLRQVLVLDARQPMALALLQKNHALAADYHFRKGRTHLQEGDEGGALKEFSLALQNNPKEYRALLELGRITQKKGHTRQAIEKYENALQIRKDLPVVWKELGKLYLQGAAYEKAARAFQRSLLLKREQPEVQELLKQAQSNYYQLLDLPGEYLQISSRQHLTRGELAAVLAVKLRSLSDLPRETKAAPRIIPDISGHWAQQYILYAVNRAWMSPYPNHNFSPGQAVTRGELAAILDRVVSLQESASQPERLQKPLIINDKNTAKHYFLPNIGMASLGVFTPYQSREGLFMPGKIVSGVEALEIIDRLYRYLQPTGPAAS